MTSADIQQTVSYIRSKIGDSWRPSVGIICGSGLSNLGERVLNQTVIQYSDIPAFPTSTVLGHKNNFLFGQIEGKNVVCMQGRFHPYEYKDTALCALPVRIMVELGIETLILTNAAGGCNTSFTRGDLMLIKDHLFFGGLALQGPLVGCNNNNAEGRFISMTNAYDLKLRQMAKGVAVKQGLQLREGIYGMSGGPHFETPAEVRMHQILGADCIGMSTCHEVVVARQCNIKVLGMSLISNICSADSDNPVETSHAEVLETGRNAAIKASDLVQGIVAAI